MPSPHGPEQGPSGNRLLQEFLNTPLPGVRVSHFKIPSPADILRELQTSRAKRRVGQALLVPLVLMAQCGIDVFANAQAGQSGALGLGTSTRSEGTSNPELGSRVLTNYEAVKLGADGSVGLINVPEPNGNKSQYIADLTSKNGEPVFVARANERLSIWGVEVAQMPNNPAYRVAGGTPSRYGSPATLEIIQGGSKKRRPIDNMTNIFRMQAVPDGRLILFGEAVDSAGAPVYFQFNTNTDKSSRLSSSNDQMQTKLLQVSSSPDIFESWGIFERGTGIVRFRLQGNNLTTEHLYPEIGPIDKVVEFVDQNKRARILAVNNWTHASLPMNDPNTYAATIFDPVVGKKTEVNQTVFNKAFTDPNVQAIAGMWGDVWVRDVQPNLATREVYMALHKQISRYNLENSVSLGLVAAYNLGAPEDSMQQYALTTEGMMKPSGTDITNTDSVIISNLMQKTINGRSYLFVAEYRLVWVYDPDPINGGSSQMVTEAHVIRLDITNGARNATKWEQVPLIIEPARLYLPFISNKARY